MANVIKVLQLQQKYSAGINTVANMIIEALPCDRYTVTMAYLEGRPEVIKDNTYLFSFSSQECRGLRRNVKSKLLEFCREEEFDIVIAHRFKSIDILTSVVSRLKIKKAIAVIHGVGDYNRWYRKVSANYYFSSRWSVVAVSSFTESYLKRSAKIFRSGMVQVIPNAIDVKSLCDGFLSREKSRDLFGINNDDFVFGAHGRLKYIKGYDYLLRAFSHVAMRHDRARLLLIGDGPDMLVLKEIAQELGVERQVIFSGYIEGANRYLRALDVFVMPSRSEGLSISLLEAMAARLPLLISDIVPVVSVAPAVAASMPVGDVVQWQSAMLDLLVLDDDARAKLADASFKQACDKFDKEEFLKSYNKLIALL